MLWEITGNGLSKPSWLFGTMHVSSKLVFHLPDSFYYALKHVDAVALELNPDIWQGQMVLLDQLEQNYKRFSQVPSSDYLNEKSFQFTDYDEELKLALSSEPTVVNSLLYRSLKTKEDFEEDTFLDLYIFQTGKKLGKRATGVEDYYQTENIILEAYGDMAKEKNKKFNESDETTFDIDQKLQDAYRRGDLNTLDSLENIVDRSIAFRDKFLYKRNEIQANSIDTILKKNSLFVGVGAAHLPGERGVIELLRKMGYTVRPVLMADRNAIERDEIDKIKVPVKFTTNVSEDNYYSVNMPGPLYKMATDQSGLDRRQYADMSNGSYYLVTRVKTHGSFLGLSSQKILNRIDSLLYENIPGKILEKKPITKNGFSGFDILNKTRRGDLQRYEIFVTPFEVIIFKISGKENYISGPEAENFFSSIKLQNSLSGWKEYTPPGGGFKVSLPEQPSAFKNTSSSDGISRWEYEAADRQVGNCYIILKKAVTNFRFIEEDTFDLALVAESFNHSQFIEKELQRSFGTFKGYPSLDLLQKMKDGSYVNSKIIIKGPHYYLLAERGRSKQQTPGFFSSFSFSSFVYEPGVCVTDTFLHYTVKSPVVPKLENTLRALVEKIGEDIPSIASSSYWPKTKNSLFESDSTGEMILVTMQQYPKYFYVRDSATFWNSQVEDYMAKNDLLLKKKDSFTLEDGSRGYELLLSDTNTTRQIRRRWILKDDRLYRLVTLTDSSGGSVFIKDFLNTFRPTSRVNSRSIFKSTVDSFLADFYSKDSATHAKASFEISNVLYQKGDVPKILTAIKSLTFGNKDYFDNKARFIAELGYIHDSTVSEYIVRLLKELYDHSTDTSLFQNKVVTSLAKQRTRQAYQLLKEILIQDPPAFESDYEYNTFFSDISDSLKLAKNLFPDILQLYTIDDYRDNLNSLLVTMLDSNVITGADYENYFTKLWFDARLELKKQLGKDEKKMEQDSYKDADKRSTFETVSNATNDLFEYSSLLMPFYNKKPAVQGFYQKLLHSKNQSLQLKTAVLMLSNNLPVPDSLLLSLAAEDKFRSTLFVKLKEINRMNYFPVKYNDQLDIARSILISGKDSDQPDSISFIKKEPLSLKGKKGIVYFFKYRIKKTDAWKIGISGLQPVNIIEVNTDNIFAKMTDKKLKENTPLEEQLQVQLKKMIYASRKSSSNFYEPEGYSRFKKTED